MWKVEFTREASGGLARIPRNLADLIRKKIAELARNPHAPNNNVKALKGEQGFRLRVGGWRVVYVLRNDVLTIVILRIAPRGRAYP